MWRRGSRGQEAARCAPGAIARYITACQRQDWKEGGHKGSCRPQKDFRKDDVVVAQGVGSPQQLNGQLFVVVGPATAKEGRWLVLNARMKNLHADKLRLVLPAEDGVHMG